MASSSSTTRSRGIGSSREEWFARASHICLNLPETFLRVPNRFCFTAPTETATPETAHNAIDWRFNKSTESYRCPGSLTFKHSAQFHHGVLPKHLESMRRDRGVAKVIRVPRGKMRKTRRTPASSQKNRKLLAPVELIVLLRTITMRPGNGWSPMGFARCPTRN